MDQLNNIDDFSENEIAVTDEESCNAFVNYFTSVFTNKPNVNEEIVNFKSVKNTMEDTVLTKLKNLKINKSLGYDNIHPKII